MIEVYGTDGTYTHGWAYYERLELTVRLVQLQIVKRRRAGTARPSSDETRLFMLTFTRWWRSYLRDRERQRVVAELLRLEWPPTDALGSRPWCWGHEAQPIPSSPVAVAYAHDWCSATHPDLYDLGGVWTAGTTLVIPADAVPVDAEVLDDHQAARRRTAPSRARALEDGIDDAIVVPEPSRQVARLGSSRVIGTWAHDTGFSPWTDHPFGW